MSKIQRRGINFRFPSIRSFRDSRMNFQFSFISTYISGLGERNLTDCSVTLPFLSATSNTRGSEFSCWNNQKKIKCHLLHCSALTGLWMKGNREKLWLQNLCWLNKALLKRLNNREIWAVQSFFSAAVTPTKLRGVNHHMCEWNRLFLKEPLQRNIRVDAWVNSKEPNFLCYPSVNVQFSSSGKELKTTVWME